MAYRFTDPERLAQALTHRSVGRANNERLEFLGDALVNLLVAELLFERHPRASEGELTRLRALLVSGAALADLARSLDLGERLRLGPGELKSGGHRRDSILADAFEALVAAVYLDGGWDACRRVVRDLFAARVDALASAPKDPKTQLQERLQAAARPLPQYELLAAEGEDHAKVFEVACILAEPALRTCAKANSRRGAEQLAAEAALQQLERERHEQR
ncbi:MAG TPA: ribonuclease III [Rhodanobacteraceae bacterium]|nr:ribonuclease III [Rhodanobacteraceae bacterium]